jgi:predicted RNA methylase
LSDKIKLKGKQKVDVYTPDSIISKMFSYVERSTCFCDPACGTGNILVFITKELLKKNVAQKEIIDRIYGYEIDKNSVAICIDRLKQLLPDIDKSLIENKIKCLNTLNDLSIQNKKYDAIVMNPPYEKDLHKEFMLWAQKHSDKFVSIQPCQTLYRHPKSSIDKAFMQTVLNFCESIEIYNPNLIFENAVFSSPVGIFYFTMQKIPGSKIYINDMMRDDSYYSNGPFLYKYNTELKDFRENIFSYLNGKQTVKDHIFNSPGKEWSVEIPKIRGHLSLTEKDIYDCSDIFTFIPDDRVPSFNSSSSGRLYVRFSSKEEAENFILYLRTFFARACLSISKHGLHNDCNELKLVPWLDFSKKWTDKDLFALLGDTDKLYDSVVKVIPKYSKK